ncbi:DNA repair protein RecN [candidate division KSB1 bacterium]
MLNRIRIENYALIDNLSLEFHAGLNVLTGETGAGKSIIIGALGLLTGERASADLIRSGESEAVVEACFSLRRPEGLRELFTEIELEPDEELVLNRVISAGGRGRAYVSGRPVSLGGLRRFTGYLLDLHGQHDHQSLLDPEWHLRYLDGFAGLSSEREAFGALFREYKSLAAELKELLDRRRELQEREELYRFQIDEIKRINPSVKEEEELLLEKSRLENQERLARLADLLIEKISESSGSVLETLGQLAKEVDWGREVDPELSGPAGELDTTRFTLENLAQGIASYRRKLEFDPDRGEAVGERLAEIGELKRKYGGSVEEVLARLAGLEKDLGELDRQTRSGDDLKNHLSQLGGELTSRAEKLSVARRKSSREFQAKLPAELAELGMARAAFQVRIDSRETETGESNEWSLPGISENGRDLVEFLISVNPGEDIRPLKQVASGGEISRIMLALKHVLANVAGVESLVFDEIDTGIGGRTAEMVGRKLRAISGYRQVIAITHLPVIACLADRHIVVDKKVSRGRTTTRIREVSDQDRVMEIATMLAGRADGPPTTTAIEHARELLQST